MIEKGVTAVTTVNHTEPDFVTPKELSRMLNITLPAAYRLMHEELPSYKIRKNVRCLKSDVDAYLERVKHTPDKR